MAAGEQHDMATSDVAVDGRDDLLRDAFFTHGVVGHVAVAWGPAHDSPP